jgi:Uma2 family endonuclease
LITPCGRFVPDLTIAPEGFFAERPAWREPAGEVEMVVEVTSSRPELDREAKRRGYAAAGIPLYLLVDREEMSVTIFSDPRGGYHHWGAVLLGNELEIPAPLEAVLDTGLFPAG